MCQPHTASLSLWWTIQFLTCVCDTLVRKDCMVTFKMFVMSQSIDVHWVWWPTCWTQCPFRKSTSNSTRGKPSFWLSRHICLFAQERQIRKLFFHIFCPLTSCSCCRLPKREIPSIDSSLSYQLLDGQNSFKIYLAVICVTS